MEAKKTPLSPDDQKRANVLLKLHDTAWANFDRLRSYEWKIALAVWTSLAVLLGFALKGEVQIPGVYWWLVLLLFGSLLSIQYYLQRRICLSNRVHQKRGLCYEWHLNEILELDFEPKSSRSDKSDSESKQEEVQAAVEKAMGWWRLKGWWGTVSILFISVLLTVSTVLVVLVLKPSKRSSSPKSREITARTFKVERVVDGDTFKVVYDGELTSVRLIEIDAPELKTPEGAAATAALDKLIGGKMVRLRFPGLRRRDDSGRLLCRVYADVNVGDEMIRQKHAVKNEPEH